VSLRGLLQLLAFYIFILVVGGAAIRQTVSLRPIRGALIASVYKGGERVARRVVASEDPALVSDLYEGGMLAYEQIVAESPVASAWGPAFALSFVSGKDGVKVTLGGKTAYVTPDELLLRQGYDHGLSIDSMSLSVGVDAGLVLALASLELGVLPSEVAGRATFTRIRTERHVPGSLPPSLATAESLTAQDVQRSARQAALHLARGVSPEGRFRYLIDVGSNKTLLGYDWPRHAGATYFLVQAAHATGAAEVKSAAGRALSQLRDHALQRCGDHVCIGDADAGDFEIGSVALATVAFAEAARTGLDPGAATQVRALAETLLAQQRPDGEFMHQLTLEGAGVNVQFLYFSGEATLALSRAHLVTGDPRYLAAASKGLAHLVGPAWHFFGDRYYFGEEHWTCQAMGDLWDRAPDRGALDFCERWQAFGRVLQMREGDSSYDSDGAIGVGPVVTPRLTPVASRCEAGVATLDVLRKDHAPAARTALLAAQLRRAMALLVRQQLHGQYTHLMADPDAVSGAFPGSEVDWQLRIDYAQHAGSAMVRWLEVEGPR
jgi:hypothetical protein